MSKSMKKLLFEYGSLVDKQTQLRKQLEWAEESLKRARKAYEDITREVESAQREIIERDKLKDEYPS